MSKTKSLMQRQHTQSGPVVRLCECRWQNGKISSQLGAGDGFPVYFSQTMVVYMLFVQHLNEIHAAYSVFSDPSVCIH